MLSAEKIVNALKEQNITHAIGVPDNGSARIYELLHEEQEIEVITVAREGEAFALAAGLYVGGKKPIIIIQNTGFLESGDAIRGTVINMHLPIVVIIGFRGYYNRGTDGKWVDSATQLLQPTLQAWKIPYQLMLRDDDIGCIDWAYDYSADTSLPSAILLVGHAQ